MSPPGTARDLVIAVAFCPTCHHWAYRHYCHTCGVFFVLCLCPPPPPDHTRHVFD